MVTGFLPPVVEQMMSPVSNSGTRASNQSRRHSKRRTQKSRSQIRQFEDEIDQMLEKSRAIRAGVMSRRSEVLETYEIEDKKLSRELANFPPTYPEYVKVQEKIQAKKQRTRPLSIDDLIGQGTPNKTCHALNFHLARQGEGRHHHRTGLGLDPVAREILTDLADFLEQQGVPAPEIGSLTGGTGTSDGTPSAPGILRSQSFSEGPSHTMLMSASEPILNTAPTPAEAEGGVEIRTKAKKKKKERRMSEKPFAQATISHMLRVTGDTFDETTGVSVEPDPVPEPKIRRKKKTKKRRKAAASIEELEGKAKQKARNNLFEMLDSAHVEEEFLEQEIMGTELDTSVDTKSRLEMLQKLDQMQEYYSKQILGLITDYQPKLPTADINLRGFDAMDMGMADPQETVRMIEQSVEEELYREDYPDSETLDHEARNEIVGGHEQENDEGRDGGDEGGNEDKKLEPWEEGQNPNHPYYTQQSSMRSNVTASTNPQLPMAEMTKNLTSEIVADKTQFLHPQDLPVIRHADEGGHTVDHGLREAIQDHTTYVDPSFPSLEFYRRKHMDHEGYLMPGFKPKHYGPGQSEGGYWVSSRAKVRSLKKKKKKGSKKKGAAKSKKTSKSEVYDDQVNVEEDELAASSIPQKQPPSPIKEEPSDIDAQSFSVRSEKDRSPVETVKPIEPPQPLGWAASVSDDIQVKLSILLDESATSGKLPPPPHQVLQMCKELGLNDEQADEVLEALYDHRTLPFVPQSFVTPELSQQDPESEILSQQESAKQAELQSLEEQLALEASLEKSVAETTAKLFDGYMYPEVVSTLGYLSFVPRGLGSKLSRGQSYDTISADSDAHDLESSFSEERKAALRKASRETATKLMQLGLVTSASRKEARLMSTLLSENQTALRLYHASRVGAMGTIREVLGSDLTAMRWAHPVTRRTALHVAASQGHRTVMKMLLEEGADVDAKDCDGQTPLHLACFEGHHSSAALLMEWGPSADLRNGSGDLPAGAFGPFVPMAIRRSIAELVRGDIEEDWKLYHACRSGNLELVLKLLCPQGKPLKSAILADPRYCHPSTGRRPLHLAACYGHVFLMRLLIEKGAPVNAQDINGLTALDYACHEGHVCAVVSLLKAGATLPSKKVTFASGIHKSLQKEILSVLDRYEKT